MPRCVTPAAPRPRAARGGGNPVPARIGGDSPVKHVIYIVKENRTTTKEFGGLGKGNGDSVL
jgi:hypothetical protein